jgi:hypothetical protein
MNSLEKQGSLPKEESQSDFLLAFDKMLLASQDHLEIELLMTKLKFLGNHFDPFHPEVTSECQALMIDLGLTPHLQNPYLATNILLRLLDKTEERLKNLKH